MKVVVAGFFLWIIFALIQAWLFGKFVDVGATGRSREENENFHHEGHEG